MASSRRAGRSCGVCRRWEPGRVAGRPCVESAKKDEAIDAQRLVLLSNAAIERAYRRHRDLHVANGSRERIHTSDGHDSARAPRSRHRPQRPHHVDVLVHAHSAFGQIDAHGCELGLDVPGTDTDDQTALRDAIDAGELLGEHDGMVQRKLDDPARDVERVRQISPSDLRVLASPRWLPMLR
jgi:hypothetical protein